MEVSPLSTDGQRLLKKSLHGHSIASPYGTAVAGLSLCWLPPKQCVGFFVVTGRFHGIIGIGDGASASAVWYA